MRPLEWHFALGGLLTLLTACSAPAQAPGAPHSGSTSPQAIAPPLGVYAVWHGTRGDVFDSAAVVGGQVWAQWDQLEPAPGEYDFRLLDERLDAVRGAGRVATVQLNANRHPSWVFERVPYIPVRLHTVQTERGTPMYWHPRYVAAQRALLDALANWIATHPHRDSIAAVRMSFNAVGTEGLAIPKDYHRAATWQHADGVPRGADWSSAEATAYAEQIVDHYIERLAPIAFLLVRRSLFQRAEDRLGGGAAGARLRKRLQPLLDTGRAGIFHTSSDIQPRNAGYSREVYRTMREQCRGQRRICYAEAITTAEGRRTQYPSTAVPAPGQWFYWRVLSDLSLGVSRVAVNRQDLIRRDEPGFAQGLVFAARHVGAHLQAARANGAWLAFREGDYLTGDYGVLARADGCGTRGSGKGPPTQPYGLWASHLKAKEPCTVHFDEDFIRQTWDTPLLLTIVARVAPDGEPATLGIVGLGLASGRQVTVANTGEWRRITLEIPALPKGAQRPGNMFIEALGASADLHLVELLRAQPMSPEPRR